MKKSENKRKGYNNNQDIDITEGNYNMNTNSSSYLNNNNDLQNIDFLTNARIKQMSKNYPYGNLNDELGVSSDDNNNIEYLKQNQNSQENQEEKDEFLNFEKLRKDYKLHFDDNDE